MKERPILFSGEMVRAILEGRKTQTRRVLKKQPIDVLTKTVGKGVKEVTRNLEGKKAWFSLMQTNPNRGTAFWCSYGEVGDRLWVREAWGYHGLSSCGDRHEATVSYAADGSEVKVRFSTFEEMMAASPEQNFKPSEAFEELPDYEQGWEHSKWLHEWWQRQKSKPSIHMYRWASRIDLAITNVRVERLQDISEEDAEAEGIECFDPENDASVCRMPGTTDWEYPNAKMVYEILWNKINGKKHPWDSNPYVWVIEFAKI